MDADQLREAVALGREQRSIEFKGPNEAKGDAFHKVVRGMLAMANNADGGHVVVGVNDDGVTITPTGLTKQQLKTWLRHDEIHDALAKFADPFIEFNIHRIDMDGLTFVAVEVFSFRETPVICARPYSIHDGKKQKPVLREGALYVRTWRKPESMEVSTSADMREIINLATDRQLLVARRRNALMNSPHDADLYAEELRDLL